MIIVILLQYYVLLAERRKNNVFKAVKVVLKLKFSYVARAERGCVEAVCYLI